MSGRASAALDAAGRGADLVRRQAGWVGLLVLTALPVRLLTAYLLWQAWRLGDDASGHGDALRSLAWLVLGAWVLSLLGRQVFVRACAIELDGARPATRAVLRLRPAALVGMLQLALLIEVVFWVTLPLLLPALPLLVLAALASACPEGTEQGWTAPLRRLFQVARPLPMTVLGLGFLIALPVVVINLHLLVRGALWLAGGAAGLDVAYWEALLSPMQPLYWAQLVAGATLVLEPFWIATAVVEARQARARSSGEDLRQWFGELTVRERA
jgi:hypothetical protein